MLQVMLLLVCLDSQQQLAQLHLTMVPLVLTLRQEAWELQLQVQVHLLILQLAQLAQAQVVAHQVLRLLQAAVLLQVLVLLAVVVVVVAVLLLVLLDPQVEVTEEDINTNPIYHMPIS